MSPAEYYVENQTQHDEVESLGQLWKGHPVCPQEVDEPRLTKSGAFTAAEIVELRCSGDVPIDVKSTAYSEVHSRAL